MSRLAENIGNRGPDLRRGLLDGLIAAGAGSSEKGLDDYARQAAGVAAGQGRQAGLETLPEPAEIYASELNDRNTCPACYGIDGTRYATIAESLVDYPSGGYVNCDGGLRCRGTRVFVWATEAPPTEDDVPPAPPEPGPTPRPGDSGPSPYPDPFSGDPIPYDLSHKDPRFEVPQAAPIADPEILTQVEDVVARSAAAEPRISAAMREIEADLDGGSLSGYEFRLKVDPGRMDEAQIASSRARIAQKIGEDVDATGLTPAEIAEGFGDGVRFTITADPEDYAQVADEALAALRARFHEVKVKNAWADPNPGYRGINTNFQDRETGQIFEVQIHTPETSKLAKGDSHKWYEISRDVDNQPVEYRQYSTDRFQELWRPHVDNPPPGAGRFLSTKNAPLPRPPMDAPEIVEDLIADAKAIQQAGIPHRWVDEWVEAGGPLEGLEVIRRRGRTFGGGPLPVSRGEWAAYRSLTPQAQARYRDLRREGLGHVPTWVRLKDEGLRE